MATKDDLAGLRKEMATKDDINCLDTRPEEVWMRFQFIVAPLGALIIAAPGIGNAAQHCDRIDALRQIATDVGHAINAASVCREIFWPRIKALTDQFSDLVKASGANGEEFSSIQQAYDQSAIEGQRTLSSKHTDCTAAVRDLADLERAVTSQPPAAIGTGASPVQARTATVASPPPTGATTGAAVPQLPGRRRER
jgi:phage-related tail protein